MAVFLNQIEVQIPAQAPDQYPFNIPALRAGCAFSVTSPFLVFAGENGSGKSTLLSAIAQASGFTPSGGNQHHYFGDD